MNKFCSPCVATIVDASKHPLPPVVPHTPVHNNTSARFDEELLDNQELLKKFLVTTRTLQNWRTKGILPHCRIGGRVYYFKDDVAALMQRKRTTVKEL